MTREIQGLRVAARREEDRYMVSTKCSKERDQEDEEEDEHKHARVTE